MTTHTPIDIGALIVCTPGTVGGRPRIAGTRLPVHTIAAWHLAGETPDEMIEERVPHVELHQIYAALAFYYANRERIDMENARETEWADRMARKYPNGVVGPFAEEDIPDWWSEDSYWTDPQQPATR